jgi:hypothetical protein
MCAHALGCKHPVLLSRGLRLMKLISVSGYLSHSFKHNDRDIRQKRDIAR